jgi:hypothetical protein
VSLSKYNLKVSFQTRPNTVSNRAHVEFGSQICGMVESRVVVMGLESRNMLLFVKMLRSWKLSSSVSVIGKVTLLGRNFELSYPPRVKLPETLLRPFKRAMLITVCAPTYKTQRSFLTYDIDSQLYRPN